MPGTYHPEGAGQGNHDQVLGSLISDNQLSYITNVDFGRGLIKCGSAIVPFMDNFPRHTQLYKLMTTKPSDLAA